MTTQTIEKCAKCGREARLLYENPRPKLLGKKSEVRSQKSQEKEFLCFDCLNRIAPEYVDRYPGWREREQAKRRKRQQAVKNFSHRDTETQRTLFSVPQ